MLSADEILEQLRDSPYWSPKAKIVGKYIENIICPECQRPEAFAYSASPLAIICHRNNKCGETTAITRVFPNLLSSIEERYPATETDPHLPAKRFLSIRGIEKAAEGLNFKYIKNCRGLGVGGILFYVGVNSAGKEVWNGRIFNPPKGEQKGHGFGSQEGLYWQHPALSYDYSKPTYVTEGVIDALALIEMGFQAIAVLASKRDPANIDLSMWKELIFAFDNDSAGWKAHRNWHKKHPDMQHVCLPHGDWNDLLVTKDAQDAAAWIDTQWEELLFMGRLAIAKNAQEYAQVWYEHRGKPAGLFDWGSKYYFSSLSNKKEPEVMCSPVSNFTCRVVSFLLENQNPDEPVYRYNIEVRKPKGAPTRFTATANELSSAAQMTTLFLSRANAVWSGEKAPVVSLLNQITTSKAPIVRQLQQKGYDRESGGYVFREFMIDQTRKIVYPDQETGIFDCGTRRFLRAAQLPDLVPTTGTPIKDIYNLLIDAWGDRAAVGVAWTIASWFVGDIKAKCRQFPFLSYYGEPGTGKSNMMVFLNAMQCLDEEGHQIKPSDTAVGIVRLLSQRSNLFQGIIEADKAAQKAKFDFRFVLGGYNDAPLQIKGIKSTDNRTETLKLKGGIAFAQNREPWENKPQRERVISSYFSKDYQSIGSKLAFDKLRDIPLSDFGAFYISVIQQHPHYKDTWFQEFVRAKADLRCYISDNRINENHATVLAFHRLFMDQLGIAYPLESYLQEIGIAKQKECSREAGALAEYFFDLVLGIGEEEWNEDIGLCLMLKPDANEIRLHLPELTKALDKRGYKVVASTKELKEALENHSAFMESQRAVKYSWNQTSKSRRSMIFRYDAVMGPVGARCLN